MSYIVTPYKVRRKSFIVVKEACDPPEATQITSAAAAAAYLLPIFRGCDAGREHFCVLFVNHRSTVLCAKVLFSGNHAETPVYVKELVRQALLVNAAGVVLAHNHIGKTLEASREDLVVTERAKAALATVELKLLDHLILVPESGAYRSICEVS